MVRRCRRERRPRVIDKLESPLLARGLLLHPLKFVPVAFSGCRILLFILLIKFYKSDTFSNWRTRIHWLKSPQYNLLFNIILIYYLFLWYFRVALLKISNKMFSSHFSFYITNISLFTMKISAEFTLRIFEEKVTLSHLRERSTSIPATPRLATAAESPGLIQTRHISSGI